MSDKPDKFSATIVEEIITYMGNETRYDVAFNCLIQKTPDGQPTQAFFATDARWFMVDQPGKTGIEGVYTQEVLVHVPGFVKSQPDVGHTVYTWNTLDLRGVFRLEKGLVEAMESLLEFGRQAQRGRGHAVD